jgi:hypothetical protein
MDHVDSDIGSDHDLDLEQDQNQDLEQDLDLEEQDLDQDNGRQQKCAFFCSRPGCTAGSFANQFSLNRHFSARHHTTERKKNHSCSKCEKAFFTTDQLKTHSHNVHSDSLHLQCPHGCKLRNGGFKNHANLKQHLRIKHHK